MKGEGEGSGLRGEQRKACKVLRCSPYLGFTRPAPRSPFPAEMAKTLIYRCQSSVAEQVDFDQPNELNCIFLELRDDDTPGSHLQRNVILNWLRRDDDAARMDRQMMRPSQKQAGVVEKMKGVGGCGIEG